MRQGDALSSADRLGLGSVGLVSLQIGGIVVCTKMEDCVASRSAAPGPVSLGALGVKQGCTEGKKCV